MGTSSVVAPGFAHHSLLAILSHFILLLKSANLHTARQTPLIFCSPSASCLAKMFGSMSRQMVGNERIFKYRQQAAWHKCLNYCTDKWYAANGFFNTVSNLLGKNVWIPAQSNCGGSLCEESHRFFQHHDIPRHDHLFLDYASRRVTGFSSRGVEGAFPSLLHLPAFAGLTASVQMRSELVPCVLAA